MTEDEKYAYTSQLMEDISKLLKTYLINMGVDLVPEIKLKPAKSWEDTLDINELIKCADTVTDPILFPDGIKTKRRNRYLVVRRQVVCVIARKMRYTCESIADELGIDHATVIHAGHVVDALIKTGDQQMIDAYNDILTAINFYYKEKYGKDLSAIS